MGGRPGVLGEAFEGGAEISRGGTVKAELLNGLGRIAFLVNQAVEKSAVASREVRPREICFHQAVVTEWRVPQGREADEELTAGLCVVDERRKCEGPAGHVEWQTEAGQGEQAAVDGRSDGHADRLEGRDERDR